MLYSSGMRVKPFCHVFNEQLHVASDHTCRIVIFITRSYHFLKLVSCFVFACYLLEFQSVLLIALVFQFTSFVSLDQLLFSLIYLCLLFCKLKSIISFYWGWIINLLQPITNLWYFYHQVLHLVTRFEGTIECIVTWESSNTLDEIGELIVIPNLNTQLEH